MPPAAVTRATSGTRRTSRSRSRLRERRCSARRRRRVDTGGFGGWLREAATSAPDAELAQAPVCADAQLALQALRRELALGGGADGDGRVAVEAAHEHASFALARRLRPQRVDRG